MRSMPSLAIVQHGGALGWAVAGGCVCTTALAGLRWLRVAQREHYLPDSVSRFALRWWRAIPANQLGVALGFTGLVLAARWPGAALAPSAVVALGPLGLGLRGRTSPLRWTRRLRTLAAVWAVFQIGIAIVGFLTGFGAVVCAAGALAAPAIVDMACVITAPLERHLANKYVRRAVERLGKVKPTVVAITGSYGKTSTKGYVTHLLSGTTVVVSSPASFNNRAGLARAVNEHLAEGTAVFVAEMGTYGRGEIADLCSWVEPDVAVITAIGPVHLERFKNEEEILRAKSEIFERARVCVTVVEDPRLAALADACEAAGKRVWRVSQQVDVPYQGEVQRRVHVSKHPDGLTVKANGEVLASGVAISARPGNVGSAVAVALELGVPEREIARRLGSLPVAPHRLEPQTAPGGFTVLDDTYNSNPAGASAALEALVESSGDHGRRVVVTPGMVELGSRQREENERFSAEVAELSADLVVVGRTNRRALVRGSRVPDQPNGHEPLVVQRREEAVAWVRGHLGPGDVVLYENDLPDHYP